MTRGIFPPDVWRGLQSLDDRLKALERLSQNFSSHISVLETQNFVTTLPDQPNNGDVIYYQADATLGLMWALRYRLYQSDGVTVNPSAYRWEFIGGPPMVLEVTASSPVGGGSVYNALSGTLLTPALAGDFEITHGGEFLNGGNNIAESANLTVKLGAAGVTDTESIHFGSPASLAGMYATLSKTMVRNLAASSTLQHYVKGVNNADTVTNRFICVRPIRVSA